jgi:hypothetical protein
MQEVAQNSPSMLIGSPRGKLWTYTKRAAKTTKILKRSIIPAKTHRGIRLKGNIPGLQLQGGSGQQTIKWDHTPAEKR